MQDDHNTSNNLIGRYEKSPVEIQALLADEDFGPAITLMCKDEGIDAETALNVEDVVTKFVLGLIEPTEIPARLQELGISQEKASSIMSDLSENVFLPIEDALKEIHGAEVTSAITGGGHENAEQQDPQVSQQSPQTPVAPPEKAAPEDPLEAKREEARKHLAGVITPEPNKSPEAPAAPTAPNAPENLPTAPERDMSDQKSGPASDDTVQEKPETKNIFEEKLKRVSQADDETTEAPESTPVPPKKQDSASGVDPYREPIE